MGEVIDLFNPKGLTTEQSVMARVRAREAAKKALETGQSEEEVKVPLTPEQVEKARKESNAKVMRSYKLSKKS